MSDLSFGTLVQSLLFSTVLRCITLTLTSLVMVSRGLHQLNVGPSVLLNASGYHQKNLNIEQMEEIKTF